MRKRARGCDGRSPEASEVVAIGTCDAFDQTEKSQAMQLTRQARSAQSRKEGRKVSAAHAVDVELGALEEVQSLDGSIALALGLGESAEVTLAVGGTPFTSEDIIRDSLDEKIF